MNTGLSASRFQAIDALRGLAMVVMALDHSSHFVAQMHSPGEYWGGPFPIYDDALTFLTRFISHLAAPGFFFLMGIGMALFSRRRARSGWLKGRIIRHFLVRGLLLIVIQFVIVNRAWELSPGGWGITFYVGVMFALGGTMIIGSLLLWLSPRYLLFIAFLLFIGTEWFHPSPDQWSYSSTRILELLVARPGGDLQVWSNYPILPWLEIVVFGLAFGQWFDLDAEVTYRRALVLSAFFLVAFGFIRFLDGFGNIRPRSGDSWIDFLNVVKYPPSMVFTLLTMGLNLFFLWLLARLSKVRPLLLQPLAVFGRVPLFFYIIHLFLYATMGYLFAPQGMSLIRMYPLWLLGLLLLFPLCLLYGRFKQRQPVISPWRFI